jgi:hypothetical protein
MVLRLLLALLCAAVSASAAAAAVAPEDLRRHIDILASNSFEGRAPGTAGEKKTTDYIVAQWQALGLEPAGDGGGWYQPVAVTTRTALTQSVSLRGRRASLDLDQRGIVLIGARAEERLVAAPVYFAGYGIGPGRPGIRGAVVLLTYAGPGGMPPFEQRAKRMAAQGAAAVIGIYPREARWRAVQAGYETGMHGLDLSPLPAIEGALSEQAARRLFGIAGESFDRLSSDAADPSFLPRRLRLTASANVTTHVRRTLSNNVIGRLRGTAGGGQSVLYLAHWDHMGICGAEGAADRICNGAVDNASGIASLIEIARGLAAAPRPARDMIFLATTAEELGLLGATWFAARPPVPLAGIVAALNLDTVAIAPKGEKVAVIGRGLEPLDRLVDETIRAQGRVPDLDGEADAFVERQDGWALAQKGVPALMIGGSFSNMALLEAFLAGPYHQAADNPGPDLVLGGAAEDAELLIVLGRKLADPAVYPHPSAPARP